MAANDDDTRVNLAWWNERAAVHRHTPLYQAHLERLRGGGSSLLPLERHELGDLTGLRVLHVQCHIGTDTLSLTRLGATVTGVDFSQSAIDEARALARELGISASFECLENGDLPDRFSGQFDLVFTSHGVLTWLPDLAEWGRQLAACLAPGGRLYLSESHPLVWAFSEERPVEADGLRLGLSYLAQSRPDVFVESGSYADRDLVTHANETREWSWGLGDVVNALIGAGLTLDWLREHPVGFYPAAPELTEGADGHYRLPAPLDGKFPLTFTVQARKSEITARG